MEALRFRQAAFALRTLWTQGNLYLDRVAPWHEPDSDRVACILRTCINLARVEAVVSHAFVPFACERLSADLGLTGDERRWPAGAADELRTLQPGRSWRLGEPLFPRIADRSTLAKWVADMEAQFGGREQPAS